MCIEFSLNLKGEQLEDVFQRQWELWCPAVIEYALQVQNKPAQLKNALCDLESGYEGEYERRTSLMSHVLSLALSLGLEYAFSDLLCVCLHSTNSRPTHYCPSIHCR